MRLSLDIMLTAGAFVLLDTGAALVAPYARCGGPGRDLGAWQRYGMGRPGTCEIPCTAACKAGRGNRHPYPEAAARTRRAAERESEHETASDTRGPEANP